MSPSEWGERHCPICIVNPLTNPRQKYCSPACKQKAYNRRKGMPKGLSDQYVVVDRNTGKEAIGVFVIDPVNDPSGRAALLGYARDVEENNWKLANDLRLLVMKLDSADREQRQTISGNMDIPDWLLKQSRDQETNGDGSDI